jgi:hypothetical protein
LFASLVVAVAGVNHYLLEQHPPSEASGLLWRVENALSTAQDLLIDLAATEYGGTPVTVRMVVRAIVAPIPALSVEYTEPESLAGQIVTVENDLLSHYLPQDDLIVVRRWSGVPLAGVGLAGLDMSKLRSDIQQGTVTARVVDDVPSLSSNSPRADFTLAEPPIGVALSEQSPLGSPSFAIPVSELAVTTSSDAAGPRSYIVEVTDAKSGRLAESLWIDRGTYFIQKVVYYENGQRVRVIEVERMVMNQGMTIDEVLILPRASVTIRG